MSFWSVHSICAAAGGTWLVRAAVDEALGIAIDSRAVRPGQVFVALPGERTDGRRFVKAAFEAGSRLAIVEPGPVERPKGMGLIQVPDARQALVRLASAYRASWPSLKVVAVTGSCGKTTTVRLIDAVLSASLRGSASKKSHNNELGVPLTLLNVKPGDQYVVCEVGTSGPGEIERLTRMCQPDVAVVTSIGRAHLAGLGSIEGVAQEKAQLFLQMAENGFAVLPAEAPALGPFSRAVPVERRVFVGVAADADLRLTDVETGPAGVRFSINERGRFQVPMLGVHNALNAAYAVAVGRRFGLTDERIAAGLAAARGPEMRLEVSRAGAVTVINDAYNANPDSMLAALRTLAGHPGERRVAVLGDMLELGPTSAAEHAAVGDWIAEHRPAEVVVLVGGETRPVAEACGAAAWFEALDDAAIDEIVRLIRPGDVVLLKGSRRVGLERVGAAITEASNAGSSSKSGAVS